MDKSKSFAQIEREYDELAASVITQRKMIESLTAASKPFCPMFAAPTVAPESYPKLNLADCSWYEIATYAAGGLAPYYFKLGDTKAITLKDGTDMGVRIIGFNHDLDSTGKALLPITFETVQTLNEDFPMNDKSTNKGGWRDSDLRKGLNGKFFQNMLPDDLREVIKPCVKLTGLGGGSDERGTTVDSLFVLSEQEVFGRKIYSIGGEGRWYEWYRQEDTPYCKRKQSGEPDWRWERSPYGSNAAAFCCVGSTGDATTTSASVSGGVSFGFCV